MGNEGCWIIFTKLLEEYVEQRQLIWGIACPTKRQHNRTVALGTKCTNVGKWKIVFEFSPGKPDTGVGIHAVRERGRLIVVNLFHQFALCRGFTKEGKRINDPVRLPLDQLGGNTASECGYLVGHRAVDECGDHVVRRDALDIARECELQCSYIADHDLAQHLDVADGGAGVAGTQVCERRRLDDIRVLLSRHFGAKVFDHCHREYERLEAHGSETRIRHLLAEIDNDIGA